MRTERTAVSRLFAAVVFVSGLAAIPIVLPAQGCEPIRFTTPVGLGGEGEAYQAGRQWRLTLAYRRLLSNEWFVGTEENTARAPGGQPPVIKINTLVADVAYALSDRFRVRLSMPFSSGSFSRKWADSARHTITASGVGDVSLMGEAWLFSPRTHEEGNLAFGLGVKAPTGSDKIGSRFYTATGSVEYPAHQSIQPGDEGWGFLVQAQGFRQLYERTFLYAFGSYMANPRARSDVRQSPNTGAYYAVPDVYSAKLGAAYALFPGQGLSVSLGGRLDGIPKRDLVGGGDEDNVKQTAQIIFAEPGLSLTRGTNTFTLGVPVRLRANRQKSLLEQRTNGLNGGGFAKYLIFASYSYRL